MKLDSDITAVIYTKPNCVKCRMTKMQLHLPMTVHMATDDDYTRFKAKGYQSMPVVEILQDGKQLDEWSDMRVDKMHKWNEA